MDQRFSIFSLEKYRLQLQQGTHTIYEDEINTENVRRPNVLKRWLSHIVGLITISSRMFKDKENILMESKGITKQSFME